MLQVVQNHKFGRVNSTFKAIYAIVFVYYCSYCNCISYYTMSYKPFEVKSTHLIPLQTFSLDRFTPLLLLLYLFLPGEQTDPVYGVEGLFIREVEKET